jgi:HlyD family secretion protein
MTLGTMGSRGIDADTRNRQNTMDVVRDSATGRRIRRRLLLAVAGLVLVGTATFWIYHLKKAPPLVDRSLLWIDTVKRGTLFRQVRGSGSLVPEEISWIAARNDGRIEKIFVLPGTEVKADTVLLVMNNPELQQSVLDADGAVTAAEAKLVNLKAQLQSQSLERQASLAKAAGDQEAAAAELEVNERLAKEGLIAALDLKKSRITAQQAAAFYEIEKKRFEFAKEAVEPQLAVAQEELDQAKAQAALRHSQLNALQVRAGMKGVLQQIAAQVGQRVTAGTNLARVADPSHLKAQVKIPETQARDITVGQTANIDTRTSGIVVGQVSRIDPAVQQGTVLVDVAFDGVSLPHGARPDMSIEGVIELERLSDVTFVGRPAVGGDESVVELFKLTPNGTEAERVKVKLGRGSINEVEVKEGLVPGDRVILSEMSSYESHEVIRLR